MKLDDRCIDCGECIKVCEQGAIVPLTDQMADLSKFDCAVAIPSAALYAQFDKDLLPGMLVAALQRCGFHDVEPLSPACDEVSVATEIFLSEYRGEYPVISSFCPTVVRLVQVKYPEFVAQLLPILAPREISARNAKMRISAATGLPANRVGAVYITPCPAKIVAILEHPGMTNSYLDAAVSITDLFQTLAMAVSSVREAEVEMDASETASGVSWAFLGGLPRSVPAENTLSVAGLPNVIRILDDVAKGKLRRYSFIECHACPEGCVSGCLTVENPYVARGKIVRLCQKLPAGPVVDRKEVERCYRERSFLMDEPFASRPLRPLDENISVAIAKMRKRDQLISELLGIDCGACGAPSCRAFAEDVILGEVERESCTFFWQHELANRVEDLVRLIQIQKPAKGG
jgi:ferredoxin